MYVFFFCLASCWLDASCPAGEAAAFLLAQRNVPWLQAAVAVAELFAAAAAADTVAVLLSYPVPRRWCSSL